LEQALELFKLPRKLGQTPDGFEVEANVGRFGPYIRYGKNFVSLKKEDDPYTVDLARALDLIRLKAEALEAATIKIFDDTGIRIVKGRFGPYITDGTRKARIPRGKEPEALSVFECEAYLAEAEAAKKPVRKSKAKAASAEKADKAVAKAKPAKKVPAKKVAARKAPAKKTAARKKAGA
ncbi:MAG: topoisomerase C-terminal repeat-containing protein, partial [Stenotrophobium sp.]